MLDAASAREGDSIRGVPNLCNVLIAGDMDMSDDLLMGVVVVHASAYASVNYQLLG